MVDRKARDKFAELLRHFIAGQITNDEFENQIPLPRVFSSNPADPAITEIWWIAAWPLYDDFEEHTLTGEYRVPDEYRREIAKCVLFLKADQEYQWPRQTGLRKSLMFLLWLIISYYFYFKTLVYFKGKTFAEESLASCLAWPRNFRISREQAFTYKQF